MKPRIDRTNLKPIVVRAGKPINYDVNVRGEPPPTITWYQADKLLKSENNVEIVNVDYNTKLNIKDSVRKNTGLYKIVAENQHGKDEETVEITVLCESMLMLLVGVGVFDLERMLSMCLSCC